jgi:hypothetical protein
LPGPERVEETAVVDDANPQAVPIFGEHPIQVWNQRPPFGLPVQGAAEQGQGPVRFGFARRWKLGHLVGKDRHVGIELAEVCGQGLRRRLYAVDTAEGQETMTGNVRPSARIVVELDDDQITGSKEEAKGFQAFRAAKDRPLPDEDLALVPWSGRQTPG